MRTHRLEHYTKASVQEVDEEEGFIGSSVTLHHDTWQSWWTKVLEGTVPHQDLKLQPQSFKVIWWDPMYDASQQVYNTYIVNYQIYGSLLQHKKIGIKKSVHGRSIKEDKFPREPSPVGHCRF